MRQIFIVLCMALLSTGAIAQVGLEDIVIETYYVANATDIAFSGVDPLPTGAVTYRMYVDLAPGWELQAIFGATNVGTGEVDTLVVRSTAPFWNHTDFGALYGYGVQASRLDDNTVGLDSWFSTGRSSGSAGGTSAVLEVLPSEDTNGAAPTHPHTPANLLQHNDPLAGLPLTTEDGNIPFASTITWTPTPGIEGILDPVFNNVNSPATEVVVSDGALGVTVSLQGPTAANRICIGQFTTAGVFSGQINLQIRNTTTLVVETYVAETPAPGQFQSDLLTWGPNALPTVDITSPAEGADFAAAATVNISATAADSDGSITQVEFFKDGVSFAVVPFPGPYDASFVAGLVTTTHTIEAVATDDGGATAVDSVHVDILGNNPPVVNLTAPPTAITGTTVNISATATDPDGITQVEFFFDGASIAVVPSPGPYVASFTATPAGVRLIEAVATDGLGADGSDSQNITITNNAAPTVTITEPDAGDFVSEGPVSVTATAADSDGSVAGVEFFANGSSIGTDNTPTLGVYEVTWTAVYVGPFGDVDLTAVATDNLGLTGSSTVVPVTVINPAGAPYIVEDVDQACNETTLCMPIRVISDIDDVIGFDIALTWDNTKIYPTGNIFRSNEVLTSSLYETDNSIDLLNEEMLISVFLDVDAPFGTSFDTTGQLICVEFAKRPSFQPVDTTTVQITSFQESYFAGVIQVPAINPGDFTTFRNTLMTSNLEFWLDDSPIGNDGANVAPTIQANGSINCGSASAAGPGLLTGPVSTPDANGYFSHDLDNGVKISINKTVGAATDVQEVVNGFDALLTRRVLIEDLNFIPNVYQAIAMDVNRDGVVSAGDVSQINQRAVLILDEFRQAWNYNADGTQGPSYAPSKDWQFIDRTTALFNPNYQVSTNFPQDNGVGFSRFRVPQVPFCLTANVTSFATCPVINAEEYVGIMYGDVNGNWTNTSDPQLRSSSFVKLDLGKARFVDNYIDVPVSFASIENVNSVDLNLDFNGTKLAFHSLIANGIQAVGHLNMNDKKLRITSNSLNVLAEGAAVFMIRFERLTAGEISTNDFNAGIGYLNGDKVNLQFDASVNPQDNDEVVFNVYPNPAKGFLHVDITTDVTAEIIDVNGRILSSVPVTAYSSERLDVSHLPSGVYTVRVFSGDYTSARRIFVGK